MSHLIPPKPPQVGPPEWKSWARSITRFVEANQLFPGLGCILDDIGGGKGKKLSIEAIAQAIASIERRPFELVASATEGDNPQPRLRVVFSTIDGDIPTGFSLTDEPPFLLVPAVGTRVVLVKITIDGTGNPTGREITQATVKPADTTTVKYAILGSYTFDAENGFTAMVNAGYGPVDVGVCQLFFTEPVEYDVSITLK
jgi:hypothetical protein